MRPQAILAAGKPPKAPSPAPTGPPRAAPATAHPAATETTQSQ